MKKILVVDDSKTIRQHVAAALAPAGFDVLEAEDGQAGLTRVTETPDLALVFCDVDMPQMTGIELVAALQARGRVPALPVIMLTTEARVDQIDRAKQAGAKGWIVKPFKPEQLVAVARRVVKP